MFFHRSDSARMISQGDHRPEEAKPSASGGLIFPGPGSSLRFSNGMWYRLAWLNASKSGEVSDRYVR